MTKLSEYNKIIEKMPELYKDGKLDIFSGKTKETIILRFGLNGNKPMTFRQIGNHFGWKPDSARKAIINALKRIKRIYRTEFN